MIRKTEILPIEVVLEDMGINWWYGTEKEVQETLENLDAAFAEINIYPDKKQTVDDCK